MHFISAVVTKREGLYLRQRVPIYSHSHILFHRLKWSGVPNDYLQYGIVRLDTDESLLIYPEQLQIIKLLLEGKSVGEVLHLTGFDLDLVVSLLNTISKSGYLFKVDDIELFDGYEKIRPWLLNVNRKWFTWVLWKPLLAVQFVFLMSGLMLGYIHPEYIPRFSDFIWHPDIFIVVVATFFSTLVLTLFHEWFHFIFTKAVGGEGRIQLFGNRFFDFVFETFNYHLELVPRQLRYFVYLAGMFCDFMVIALIFWIFNMADAHNYDLGLLRNFLSSVILIQIIGVIWQFNIYLQTDIYNFFSDFFGQENLYINSIKYIGLKIKHMQLPKTVKRGLLRVFYTEDVIKSSDDLRSFTLLDRRPLVIYSCLLIVGLLIASLNLLLFSVPRGLIFITFSFQSMWVSIIGGETLSFFKFLVAFILSICTSIGVILLIIKKIIRKNSFI
ncbi:MAG: hypothetical protein M3Q44_02715 [bacterium]|nr:hypothetical protein [bacterium]